MCDSPLRVCTTTLCSPQPRRDREPHSPRTSPSTSPAVGPDVIQLPRAAQRPRRSPGVSWTGLQPAQHNVKGQEYGPKREPQSAPS